MNLLIDTHILLWWLKDDNKLPKEAERIISDVENEVYVSAVCGWEIAIKHSIGRLDVDINKLQEVILKSGFSLLPITMQHGLKVASLPKHHTDPFDRLLIAQSILESMRLLTHDSEIQKYGDSVLFV